MSENLRRALIGVALAALFAPFFLQAAESPEGGVKLQISDDIDLTLSGELRTRYEWNDNLVDFNSDTDDEFGYVPSRARLGFRVGLPKNVAVQIDMQNLFAFGQDTPDRLKEYYATMPNVPLNGVPFLTEFPGGTYWAAPASGYVLAGSHRDDLGLYQAYIEADEIGGTKWGMRIGRQEMAFGNEWLLGNNDFYGGASLDGIRGWYGFDKGKLDLFWAKVDEQNTGASGQINFGDDDTDLFGVYYTWPEVADTAVNLDFYGIGLKSNYDGGANQHNTDYTSYWIGFRAFSLPEHGLHYNAEFTYQMGDISRYAGVNLADDMNLSAYGFEGSVGYTWDLAGNPDVHGGLTYATGDDDPADNDFDAFVAPLPDPHPRLGFADLVSASNLLAYQIGYAGSMNNQAWGLEVYRFDLAEDFMGDDHLGGEIDVWYAYQYSKNLSVQVVAAMFQSADVIEDIVGNNNTDDAMRFYTNLVVKY